MSQQQVGICHGQEWISRGTHIGCLEPGHAGLFNQRGQLHTAMFVILCSSDQPSFIKGINGDFDFRYDLNFLSVKGRFIQIILAVVVGKQIIGNLCRQVHHRIKCLTIVIGKTRVAGQCFRIQPLIHHEIQISPVEYQFLTHLKVSLPAVNVRSSSLMPGQATGIHPTPAAP